MQWNIFRIISVYIICLVYVKCSNISPTQYTLIKLTESGVTGENRQNAQNHVAATAYCLTREYVHHHNMVVQIV